MQKIVSLLFLSALILTLDACYTKARIDPDQGNFTTTKDARLPVIYQYRIGGLQQMLIFIDPNQQKFFSKLNTNGFTQEQLSKLKISVTSLGGKLMVNGLVINQNQTFPIDLSKEFNYHGRIGVIKNWDKYVPCISFASYNEKGKNLCKFILRIEDRQGFTRTTGLRVHGGFQDSL